MPFAKTARLPEHYFAGKRDSQIFVSNSDGVIAANATRNDVIRSWSIAAAGVLGAASPTPLGVGAGPSLERGGVHLHSPS